MQGHSEYKVLHFDFHGGLFLWLLAGLDDHHLHKGRRMDMILTPNSPCPSLLHHLFSTPSLPSLPLLLWTPSSTPLAYNSIPNPPLNLLPMSFIPQMHHEIRRRILFGSVIQRPRAIIAPYPRLPSLFGRVPAHKGREAVVGEFRGEALKGGC